MSKDGASAGAGLGLGLAPLPSPGSAPTSPGLVLVGVGSMWAGKGWLHSTSASSGCNSVSLEGELGVELDGITLFLPDLMLPLE